ncbi:MAG: glycosyltransferase family 4 protein [Phocaeicola sp.]|uniref:glycosyltransferase family 4 protein n=1 Tax=Phocaeicola sp. TaxID=2773926 RepID=UPI003FA00106
MKLIRITTIPLSLNKLLTGQLKMLNEYYEVIAVSSPGKDLEEVSTREKVRVVEIPMERHIALLKDMVSLLKLIRLFRKERPGIVHSLTPKAGLLSMLAARICRVPVRIHTFTGLIFPSAIGWKRKLLMMTDRITCSSATYINPEGVGVKHDLEENHITKKPLHIIANGNVNGIDLTYYNRIDEVMKAAIPYTDRKMFTFCFVGRMVHDKGINELVSAFDKLYKLHQDIRLILVGPFEDTLDPISPKIKELILHHPNILFMGWQSDIRPFLAASDAFVFPSYREGFPNVLLQAGAMDLPCIVTDINGCNEIIVEGKNGTIISAKDEAKLYDTMQNWYEHREKILTLSRNARQMIAERYEQKQLWAALLDVYKSLEQ